MYMKHILPLLLILSSPSFGDEEYGTLNPEELSLNANVQRALRGETTMSVCASGYLMTKSGRHDVAREVFEACAKAGFTGTMTWMSYMEDNGFGGDYDPDRAAEWDRKAADMGDPVGKFNYGLDLLRGHGVTKDEVAAKDWIDQAAEDGLEIAKRLQEAKYDPDEVTPDADNWKYAPMF